MSETELNKNNPTIGLISDTHIPARADRIPEKALEIFRNNKVDLIIHSGDLVTLEVLEELKEIALVKAVHGNMDPAEVRQKLPTVDSLKTAGKTIGIVHDAGTTGIGKGKKLAEENNFDVLIFGHTHRSKIEESEGILFINPGSPTEPIPPVAVKPSVGLLKIENRDFKPEIIEL